ncbi:NAD(P)-dependent oxidoreductase [uncultured Tateyamaria sp.]|uniref:NAD-dependent epimerase/dehydratase family protein n=1 Tax=uncultured Tateyamaria sp. TaxID=455651 RepID=UPI002606542D|nr:NAD-dependent epimerase/dehydratase family protein [uncultured Tateyamaria sp.]
MRIVILGADSKVGRFLRPRWTGSAMWATRHDVDITDTPTLCATLHGADAVLNLAGVTHRSDVPQTLNADLAHRVLDAAQTAGAGRVFLMSTAAVYGDQTGPLTEDRQPAPLTPYGHGKHAMEQVAVAHTHPCTIMRVGNLAGADAILGGWRPGFTLDTFADGSTPRRSYIGPTALARSLGALVHLRDAPRVVNVAAPGAVLMGALLDAAGLEWVARPAPSTAIADVTLDTTLLCTLTSFAVSDRTAQGIVADWREGPDI